MTKKEAKEIWETNRPHMEQEIINFYPTGNVFIGMTGDDMEKLDEYFADPYWKKGIPTERGTYLVTDRYCDLAISYFDGAKFSTPTFKDKIVAWHKIELYKEEP